METISEPSRIVPGASWRDPFFALLEKSSFSAACQAQIHFVTVAARLKPCPDTKLNVAIWICQKRPPHQSCLRIITFRRRTLVEA
jgi:hypothetical protein